MTLMMKAILGSAAGGVVAGVVALVASAQAPRAPDAAWPSAAASMNPLAMPVANAPALRTAITNAPTLVDCEPGQEAVLQQSIVDGRPIARVACITRMLPNAAAPMVAYGTPAAYYDNRPANPQPDIVQRPARRVAAAPARATRVSSVQREVEPKRSWTKTALIISGSAAGAATIYEAMKRK
jgi:hypothetical protein